MRGVMRVTMESMEYTNLPHYEHLGDPVVREIISLSDFYNGKAKSDRTLYWGFAVVGFVGTIISVVLDYLSFIEFELFGAIIINALLLSALLHSYFVRFKNRKKLNQLKGQLENKGLRLVYWPADNSSNNEVTLAVVSQEFSNNKIEIECGKAINFKEFDCVFQLNGYPILGSSKVIGRRETYCDQ